MLNYKTGLDFAKSKDKNDPIASYREQFHIPKDKNGDDIIYMTGNSLGLQPKSTHAYVEQELKDWAELGVDGHTHGKNPWLHYHELLTENMAAIVAVSYTHLTLPTKA